MLELETKLRNYMKEVMGPYDSRLKEMQKEMYKLVDGQNSNKNGMETINHKIDKELKIRDYVTE